MRRIQMRRLLLSVIILAAVCAVCSTASGQYAAAPDQNKEPLISIDFKDVPLSEALQTLFKATSLNYAVDPNINQLKVTAVFKAIPFDTALKSILKAAGATYRIDNGIYLIASRPDVSSNSSPSMPSRSSEVSSNTGELKIEKISLAFLESGDVINAVRLDGSVMIVSTGSDYIIIKGTESNIAATSKLIRLLDTPDALPRAVRIKLTLKATVTEQGKKSKLYEATTESVGAEGVKMPLQIQADKIAERVIDKKTQFSTNGMQISVYLTPVLASVALVGNAKSFDDKIITLSGQGQIGGSFPFTFSKLFDVTVSAAPSERVVIAAGSANISSGKVEFQVTAVTTVEKGRVQARPSSQNNNAAPAPPGSYSGFGNSGGGYGGFGSQSGF